MEQLLAVDEDAYKDIEKATSAEGRTAASPTRGETPRREEQCRGRNRIAEGHELAENLGMADTETGKKRRHRSCNVCAVYKAVSRKFTKYVCPEYSEGTKRAACKLCIRKYLCNVVREGRERTCFQTWHLDWNNGKDIRSRLLRDHKMRDRPLAKRPGKDRHCQPNAGRNEARTSKAAASVSEADVSDDDDGQDPGEAAAPADEQT
ncbi:hypothetical protein PInf_007427 [Phytophthora infestans]|nr:hypothetical protein PInf_007427 [Phytophthora infestans]